MDDSGNLFRRASHIVASVVLLGACRPTPSSNGADTVADSASIPVIDSALAVTTDANYDAGRLSLDELLPKGTGWECRTRLDEHPRDPKLQDGACWRQCNQPSPIPPAPSNPSAPTFRPPYYPCTHRAKAFCFALMSRGSKVVDCSESKATCEASHASYATRYKDERDWSMTGCEEK